ncbi:MAG: hypothetical protein C4278_01185, partial [Patescibacteria group bacterium]
MRGLIIGFLLGILVSLNYYFLYAWIDPTSNPPSGGGLIQTQPESSFPLILTTSTIVNSGNLVVQNGNVGIGTTNPEYRLDVASGGTGVVDVVNIRTNSAGGEPTLRFVSPGVTSSEARIRATDEANASLIFRTGRSDRVIIKGDGNVGIGTTNPG